MWLTSYIRDYKSNIFMVKKQNNWYIFRHYSTMEQPKKIVWI